MKKYIIGVFIHIVGVGQATALTFQQAIEKLDQHEIVEQMRARSNSVMELGRMEGSWGDPKVRVVAKNIPSESFKFDQTPMSGTEIGIVQKLPLSNKYKKIQESYRSIQNSTLYLSKDRRRSLEVFLWQILIGRKKILEEIKIFKKNLQWANKILKVSKKLYSNGKVSQQALLEIKIRKSTIERMLSNKKYELLSIGDQLYYLLGDDSKKFQYNSIPWQILSNKGGEGKDYREYSYQEKIKSADLKVQAASLSFIPDIDISLSYTKRENVDGLGDFMGVGISFPLSFSNKSNGKQKKVIHDKYALEKEYKNFKKNKNMEITLLKRGIKKIESEMNILKKRTIKYAQDLLAITSKTYGLGKTSYMELLQSELELQKILLKEISLSFEKKKRQVSLKSIVGEPLHE